MALRRFMFRGVTKVRDDWDLACAARERGRRRSAYEAPHGSVAPGPVSSGAESKRRRCPRSRARQSRITLLVRDRDRRGWPDQPIEHPMGEGGLRRRTIVPTDGHPNVALTEPRELTLHAG